MKNPAVLVPVKAFHAAKLRLAPALDAPARAELARVMAGRVVEAGSPLPVSVVCDDEGVAAWAASVGASVIWRPGRGLNGAVADGVSALAAVGHDFVIVAHGDLPHAVDLAWVAEFDGITLVPDRRDDGTNVVGIPARVHATFRFAYGPGSFSRHHAEGERVGLNVRVVREPRLAWDVDIPADLAEPSWPAT
jgi:2-phospho-L-lactate guanylyltransferase